MAHIERGGIRTLVEELDTKVNAILLGGAFYDVTSADSAVTDESVDWGVRLYSAGGEPVAESDITTPGTWKVYRIRSGATTQITAAALLSAGPGRVFCIYDFPTADWDIGDLFYFVMTGTQYLEGVVTKSVPTRLIWGRVVLEHSVEDTYAAIGDVDADLALVTASVDGLVSDLGAVKAKTDGLNFTGTDVKATLDGEKVKLQEWSIDSTTIGTNAISGGTIAYGAISADKIATNAITAMKIASNAITAAKVATDAIGAAQVAADAVTKIQAGLPLLRQIPGHNMLRDADGSCESLTGWGSWGSGPLELSTEQVYGGTYSLKKTNGASYDGISTAVGGPLMQGVTYRVRAKIWSVNGGSQLNCGIYNGRFEETPTTYYQSLAMTTGEWIDVDLLFTPLTTYPQATLLFRMSSSAGTWYLDEVSVTRADPTDTVVPATPRPSSLRDILHKDASGTYSRGTDSLEAIRDRIDTGFGATFNGSTDSLEAIRDRLDLIPGESYDAAEDALHMLSIYARTSRYFAANLGQVTTATKLYWTLSSTASTLEAPTVGSAWPGSFGDEIDWVGFGFGTTFRGPIESGPIFVQFGAITGVGSVYIHLEIKCHDDVWRQYSTVAIGSLGAETNRIFIVDPPKLVIDGVYVKSARYSLTAVGSPTVTGTLRISANWRHRLEVESV